MIDEKKVRYYARLKGCQETLTGAINRLNALLDKMGIPEELDSHLLDINAADREMQRAVKDYEY